MDILSSLLVAVVLVTAAGFWMWRHLGVWQKARRQGLEPREFDFRRRQFSRRMQTSGLLAALGISIFVGSWLTGPPLLVTLFWMGVLLLTCWLALLAAADAVATRMHYYRLRDEYVVEQRRLEGELKRLQARGDQNGQE